MPQSTLKPLVLICSSDDEDASPVRAAATCHTQSKKSTAKNKHKSKPAPRVTRQFFSLKHGSLEDAQCVLVAVDPATCTGISVFKTPTPSQYPAAAAGLSQEQAHEAHEAHEAHGDHGNQKDTCRP